MNWPLVPPFPYLYYQHFFRFPFDLFLFIFLGDLRSQKDIDQFLAPVFKLDLLRPVLGAAIDIAKGQEISGVNFLVSYPQKKKLFIFLISADRSKMGQIKKLKALWPNLEARAKVRKVFKVHFIFRCSKIGQKKVRTIIC